MKTRNRAGRMGWRATLALAAASLHAPALPAQCIPTWNTHHVAAGVIGTVNRARMWNGRLMLAGKFEVVGNRIVSNVASWDPATGTFAPLGGGVNGEADAMAAAPGGPLYVGGKFLGASGTLTNRVARWNGSSWSALGSGLDGNCTALAVAPNGDVFAAGSFTNAGGVPANSVARWNGSSWSSLGPGLTGVPWRMVVAGNGDLIISGFLTLAGLPIRVARWDGASWTSLTNGAPSPLNDLAVLPTGEVIAAGGTNVSGAADSVVQLQGNSWTSLGLSASYVSHVGTSPTGSIAAQTQTGLMERVGGTWSLLAPAPTSTNDLVYVNGQVVAVGPRMRTTTDDVMRGIAIWDGTAWRGSSTGTNDGIEAMARRPDGRVIAGGSFSEIDGVSARCVAEWNGTTWSPFGAGLDGAVTCIQVLQNGDVVVGGRFDRAAGVASRGTARWDGTTWHPMPQPGSHGVVALAELSNGTIVAAPGQGPTVLHWTGSAWQSLGTSLSGRIGAFAIDAGGDLIAGGTMAWAGTFVPTFSFARWDGLTWQEVARGIDGPIRRLLVLDDGDWIAAGLFTGAAGAPNANSIARWDGANWRALGTGFATMVFDADVMPDGSLVAVGGFTEAGPRTTLRVARYRDGTWTSLADGLGSGIAFAVTATEHGTVMMGGDFVRTGSGRISAYIASLNVPCAATASNTPSGCQGGGPALLVEQHAWVGSEFRARAALGAQDDVAVAVWGLSNASLPLGSIVPQATPGCTVGASSDALQLLLPTAGAVRTRFAVPLQPSLAGTVLHHQLVTVELALNGDIVGARASDALRLTVGTL